MISAFKKAMFLKKIQRLLNNNQIEINHYLVGRIRLKSPLWKNNSTSLDLLMRELKNEKRINSISYTKETGSLLVTFDPSPVSEKQIENWVCILEKILGEINDRRKVGDK
jgi:hypothetical protein